MEGLPLRRMKQVLWQPVVFVALVLAVAGGDADEKNLREKVCLEIPVGGDLMIVPVTLGGEDRKFVIDTSARFTAVDATLQHHLGNKVRRIPSLGEQGVTWAWTYQSPILRIGQTEFRPVEIHATDFAAGRAAGVYSCDGGLGLDCFESQVLDFDSDAGKLRLWNSPAPESICRGHRKKIVLASDPKCLSLYNSIPSLAGSAPEAFVISTALSGSVGLRDDLFDLLVQKKIIDDVKSVGTAYKDVRVKVGTLHGFFFAGKAFPELRCARMPFNVIGLGLLSRFHVVIDIPQNVMWLERGKRIEEPDSRDLSGLSIVRFVTNEVVVVEVEPDSPAAKVGIQVADQIIGVRDLEIGDGSLFRLRTRLCEPSPCEISLLRGETAIKVVLDLK